jgi:hypothetical protein
VPDPSADAQGGRLKFADVAGAAALFTVLTAVMTWPQVLHLATEAQDHQDVFFNMWRLLWVAHALATSPSHVLDGNIFYPEPRTLTFSDAMPVEAVLAAPLVWGGLPPVLVHNLLLLAGIVLSATAIFCLAAQVTGSRAAGVTAGVIFAYAPYRFEHYMHMELQWTVWIPCAFWALHRLFDNGRRRHAVWLGVFAALQFMSSVYYGIFLAALLVLCSCLLLCGTDRASMATRFTRLTGAGAIAVALSLSYALPYATTRHDVGRRSESEVLTYSAHPTSYLVATDSNYFYGARSAPRGRPERRLFTGIVPVLLALVGLLLRPATKEAITYLLGLVAAFEMSLGFYGYSFPILYRHVPLFDALRAPARLGVFVLFFLAILAAGGHAALARARPRTTRYVLLGVIVCGILGEFWVAPLRLIRYTNTPPPLYRWLADEPRGLLAEFPMPTPEHLPGAEARYAYMSTFHWMPMINGYSGYYPSSYLSRLRQLRDFPNEASLEVLKAEGVRYVIVHTASYPQNQEVVAQLTASPMVRELGRFDDGVGLAVAFAVR